jgi:hypothetical protein
MILRIEYVSGIRQSLQWQFKSTNLEILEKSQPDMDLLLVIWSLLRSFNSLLDSSDPYHFF